MEIMSTKQPQSTHNSSSVSHNLRPAHGLVSSYRLVPGEDPRSRLILRFRQAHKPKRQLRQTRLSPMSSNHHPLLCNSGTTDRPWFRPLGDESIRPDLAAESPHESFV
ncbi:hypothetical protein HBI56_139610 [Parastagonospora nodorum]|uniref:Uncharacterized protein n=1 Tax=Phaeosphaeria nodorum (strain SN15 / ATCC MYA-4574 / FGSC 10173) TaxID=321614 RepID=A0A7U2NPG4_PHANO|nr:hypothetical protein HBH56_128190 [Parastagonospora nodorum]QRD05685.1 hypothetical protein JI435_304240 [Parastagonospora nodorum SN15]KAH3931388.1 hypothetical protein HBH54_095290 [Parastagonospora nodorum]KAH3971645.1 hypothetical protein HBH52_157160 [Parastagonospora nodorum]KAH3996364.1 hypothetical protein HBI10_156260 [Parastagonospora nodorum]